MHASIKDQQMQGEPYSIGFFVVVRSEEFGGLTQKCILHSVPQSVGGMVWGHG